MTKTKILILFLFITLSSQLFAEGSVFVLCYHTFLGKSEYNTDFSVDEFEKQIEAMDELGYQFVSFQDILDEKVNGTMNLLITVDDGNKSVTNVWHIFDEYNINPILFIYPAIVDLEFNYALKFSQLEELVDKGAYVAAHGYSHLFVTQDLYDSDYTAFKREIYSAKRLIELETDIEIDTYAYPYGEYSDVTLEHVGYAGYLYSFTIEHGKLLVPIENNDDNLLLPRYLVAQDTWEDVYEILEIHAIEQKITNQSLVYK